MTEAKEEAATIISRLSLHLAAEPAVVIAVVYGSTVSGRLHPRSDVDLAVADRGLLETEKLIDLSTEHSAVCGREVQIRDLRRLEGLILHRVLTTGRAIKETDTTLYAQLALKALDFAEDLLPALRKADDAQVRRFVEGR
ncbi:MAG TPA: nucleotidyltransferase domain-containing protein [Spirochaetia bacterium]|nr:nucleotidyltransferase domain-containing protein [Spirochaetia bacterium]